MTAALNPPRHPWEEWEAERDRLWLELVGRELDELLERMVSDGCDDYLSLCFSWFPMAHNRAEGKHPRAL